MQEQLKKMESCVYIYSDTNSVLYQLNIAQYSAVRGQNDLADLRHKEHLQYEDDWDVNMDLGVPMADDGDDTWEDVADPREEPLVYAIHDTLGAR